jgi:hypothetical protein
MKDIHSSYGYSICAEDLEAIPNSDIATALECELLAKEVREHLDSILAWVYSGKRERALDEMFNLRDDLGAIEATIKVAATARGQA